MQPRYPSSGNAWQGIGQCTRVGEKHKSSGDGAEHVTRKGNDRPVGNVSFAPVRP
jgi:hypothetical protein